MHLRHRMHMTGAMSPGTKGSLLVFFGAISISSAPIYIKYIETGATAAAFYRMLFGGIALLVLSLIKKQNLHPNAPAMVFIVLAGLAFGGDLFFWHRSIPLAGPGLSTILANFQVFILAVAGVLFFGDRPSLRLFLSIALAFAGLVMLLEVNLAEISPELLRGVIYGLFTAGFLAAYILALRQTRRVSNPLPLLPNMALVSLVTAAILALTLRAEGGTFALASGNDAAMLVLYGISCQVVGWLMISAGLPHLSPGRGGLLLMVEPLCAFIWDLLIFGRQTGPIGYAGATVTIFAIYMCLANNKSSKN